MGGGEIVEVQGGHIVRSTGRKDRHSKVCTAKGPRDRRVRLSAHTAIQFYDVQDRLGYDRPSKAVDWLIKKAKNAIDQLDHLPPWNPIPQDPDPRPDPTDRPGSASNSNFLPPSLDSDAIADTIKSFFPVVSGEQPMTAGSSGLQFQQLHSSQSQDLRLSLQSLQDSSSIFHHQNSEQIASFGWADHGNHSHHQSFVFNSPEFARNSDNNNQNSHQILFGSSSSSSQRGPLQSSNNTPSVRANWIESNQSQPLSMADQIQHSIHHNQHHHHHHQNQVASSSGIGMGFGAGLFPGAGSGGFHHHFPARFQGEEEHHGGADKPSSASSDSRH